MQVNRLFLGCFFCMMATSFGFIIRAQILSDWGTQFGLSATQLGEINGAGLWPFSVSIVLMSLIIDRVGYGRAIVFAFLCHCLSAVTTMCAPLVLAPADASAAAVEAGRTAGYWILYLGNVVVALGNGTVEAVINPAVATMYSREKTKWLSILHAGWPGGLVLGGLILLAMTEMGWQYKVALIFLPTLLYGALLFGQRFPVQERVAAGVSYRDMLRELGFFGALIVVGLIYFEVTRIFESMGWIPAMETWGKATVVVVLSAMFGAYCGSWGRPLLVIMLLIMIPLATTELGVDSWITVLMEPQMEQIGLQAGWVLIYTSAIMLILRLFAGSIVHRLSPLGLLAVSSILAAIGLVALSKSAGLAILGAATIYGLGKTFFWPAMLGIVAEQFPRGGALTLNATGGVGMLGVGVVGTMFLGLLQDTSVSRELKAEHPAIHAAVIKTDKSMFGDYEAIDDEKVASLTDEQRATLKSVEDQAKKSALSTVAILPVGMCLTYLALIAYFRSRGGYRAEVLTGHLAHDERFTGGIEAPGEG